MLSYIHAYHAGNHADILKHITVSLILSYLCKKEKPFTIFDTHSGSGIYSFSDERLRKTDEAEDGIKRFLARLSEYELSNEHEEERKLIAPYIEIVRAYALKNLYPGSPAIENNFVRPDKDIQILSEFHPTVINELKENARNFNSKPQIHFRDGYEMLKALTPPEIKRGFCLIDPSYEDKKDYDDCIKAITEVHKKWSVGIIALWYPLLTHNEGEVTNLIDRIEFLAESTQSNFLNIRLEVKEPEKFSGLAALYGSGMVIVNPPYTLASDMEKIIPFIKKTIL